MFDVHRSAARCLRPPHAGLACRRIRLVVSDQTAAQRRQHDAEEKLRLDRAHPALGRMLPNGHERIHDRRAGEHNGHHHRRRAFGPKSQQHAKSPDGAHNPRRQRPAHSPARIAAECSAFGHQQSQRRQHRDQNVRDPHKQEGFVPQERRIGHRGAFGFHQCLAGVQKNPIHAPRHDRHQCKNKPVHKNPGKSRPGAAGYQSKLRRRNDRGSSKSQASSSREAPSNKLRPLPQYAPPSPFGA